SARPLSSSLLTVASPRYDLLGGFPLATFINGPIMLQVSTSPLTIPSTDPIGPPSGPCTSPLTFGPFCRSTQRIFRSLPPVAELNAPSHVPVTSTKVRSGNVLSISCWSPVLDHYIFSFSLMAWVPTRCKSKVQGQPRPLARPLISSIATVASPLYDRPPAYMPLWFSLNLNESPLIRPSIDPNGAPSSPCTSPLTFPPFW